MQVAKKIILMGGVGYDSNIYLIDEEIIIDTGTGIFFNEIKEEIINNEYKFNKIDSIINTHCHYDHTGGDKKFRDWLNASIAIHKKDKLCLQNGENTLAKKFGKKARSITVDKILQDEDEISTEHYDFTVINTPGHTPGSICLFEKNKKILISGDTLFEDSMGRTDMPRGNKNALVKSLKKIMKLNPQLLLPGHGMPQKGNINFTIKKIL